MELKEILKTKKISQKKFCEDLKIGQSAASHYMNNKRQPDIDELIRIADYLNCSLDELVGRPSTNFKVNIYDKDKKYLLELFDQMNKFAKSRMIAYAEGIISNPMARKKTI